MQVCTLHLVYIWYSLHGFYQSIFYQCILYEQTFVMWYCSEHIIKLGEYHKLVYKLVIQYAIAPVPPIPILLAIMNQETQ